MNMLAKDSKKSPPKVEAPLHQKNVVNKKKEV